MKYQRVLTGERKELLRQSVAKRIVGVHMHLQQLLQWKELILSAVVNFLNFQKASSLIVMLQTIIVAVDML